MSKNSQQSRDSPRSGEDQRSLPKLPLTTKLEGEESEVIPLQIERATSKYQKSKASDPQFSLNLRWIRNSKKNREVLTNFIIKRIIITKVIKGKNWTYLPCCNVFTRKKPTGKGHEGAKWNPLLFLLDQEERSNVLTFKKKLLLKNSSVPKNDRFAVLKPQVFSYLKANVELKEVRKLVEGLPQKDGCFHLPLFRGSYPDDCPGPCSLAESDEPLNFKVDLFSIDTEGKNKMKSSRSATYSKNLKKNQGSAVHHLKKLKVEDHLTHQTDLKEPRIQSFLSPEFAVPPPSFNFQRPSIGLLVGKTGETLPRDGFHLSQPTALNHLGALYRPIYGAYSENGGVSTSDQMGKLLTQVNGLRLGPQASSQMTEMEKSERLKYLGLIKQQKINEANEVADQIKQKSSEIKKEEEDIATIEKEIQRLIKIASERRNGGSDNSCHENQESQ